MEKTSQMHCKKCLENKPFKMKTRKKELILNELKKRGLRITNQRKLILDIILENECSCCKEIYYQAVLRDSSIGIATVYRMLKTLEEIKAIDRKNMYHISYEKLNDISGGQIILLDEDKVTELQTESEQKEEWFEALKMWLKSSGYIENEEISIIIKKSNEMEQEELTHGTRRLCCNC